MFRHSARDWTAFARGYNGPAYRRNAYHSKIASAYERYRPAGVMTEISPPARRPLLQGTRGETVLELQRALTALGYPLHADGVFGPKTEAAVRRLQKDQGLEVDGITGEKTVAAIERALHSRWSTTGILRMIAGWLMPLFGRMQTSVIDRRRGHARQAWLNRLNSR